MKILKIFKKKKIKKFTNKSQNDVQVNFYWELLEENYGIRKKLMLMINELNNLKMEKEILTKECEKLEQKISDIEEYYNTEFEYCKNCEHWFPEEQMKNVANERVCEQCVIDGYGR